MSNAVKLSAKLGKDEATNGLDHYAGDLGADPDQVLCALVWLKVRKITTDTETHTKTPTVEIRKIEVLGSSQAVPADVVELYLKLNQERRGTQDPIPFDTIDTVEGAYTTNKPDND